MDSSQYWIKSILASIQRLDEIGGPENPAEYIKILAAIKAEIEVRIECCQQNLTNKETLQ